MIHSKIYSAIVSGISFGIDGGYSPFPLPAVTHNLAQLDPLLGSHLNYANTLVFASGDTFEFEFLAPTSTVSTVELLTDGDNVIAANRAWILLDPNGAYSIASGFIFEVDGVIKTSVDSYPVDGKLHKAKFTFTASRDIKYLGCRYSLVLFYRGIFNNAVATIGGVTTTNPIGLATSGVEYPDENVFGANLIINGDFASGIASWGEAGVTTIVSNNTALVTGSTSNSRLQQGVPTIAGVTYEASCNINQVTGSNARLVIQDTGQTSSEGLIVFTATDTNTNLRLRVDFGSAEFSDIKIRQVTNALEYVNIPDANIEQYKLSGDETQWDNISTEPQELPAIIEVA